MRTLKRIVIVFDSKNLRYFSCTTMNPFMFGEFLPAGQHIVYKFTVTKVNRQKVKSVMQKLKKGRICPEDDPLSLKFTGSSGEDDLEA